ncbi:hypothetical protein H0H87_001860 [Tephrocybe sp. NHM501043]|nr:hypothetical protein H0H87_001860 [Tephrocybe sp. NHM501043]
MLPKVATTILHSTTRAVTSIQHQSYTIRNVLQPSSNNSLAPWNSSGNSHWGNGGPGPGSAKYSTGSRYYGYTGAGRAVTQANVTISSTDGSFVQSDEQDDVSTRRPAANSSRRGTRARSSSLSIPTHSRNERAENLGVLKTVQLHARSRHAFAPQIIPSAPVEDDPVPASPRPRLARRNSTSAPPPTEAFDPSIPAPSPPPSPLHSRSASPAPSLPPTDPAAPQTVRSPVRTPKPETLELTIAAKRLLAARDSGDAARAAAAVREFRQQVVHPSVREFNGALEALQATRRPGEPLNLLIDTYNDMLRHSLLPNVWTYIILIDALTSRDHEVHTAITALEGRIKHRKLTGFTEVPTDEADRKRIDMLRREVNFPTAMSLFETALSIGGNSRLTGGTYISLLRSCANHGNVNAAIHVFAQQEKRDRILPTHVTFVEMIRVYTNAGQLKGAEEIFAEYRSAVKTGDIHLFWAKQGADPRRDALLVWNQMIETYFRFDRPDKAVELVDEMLNAKINDKETLPDPPPVSTATFTTVITGFCQTGDVATALLWFDRLLVQQVASPDPYEATGIATKPDEVAWGVMLDALAVKGLVEDLNRLFVTRLEEGASVRNTERFVVFSANMAHLSEMNDEQFLWTVDFLRNRVLDSPNISLKQRVETTADIFSVYLDRKMYDTALSVLSEYFNLWFEATTKGLRNLRAPPSITEIQKLQLKFTEKLYQVSQGDVPYAVPMELARVAGTVRIALPHAYTPYMLHSYALARASGSLPIQDMTLRDWELLVMAASEFEHVTNAPEAPQANVPGFAFQGLASLIHDLATYNIPLGQMDINLVRKLIIQMNEKFGSEAASQLFHETGFASIITNPHDPAAALSQAIDNTSAPVSDFSGSDSGYVSASTTTSPTDLPRLRIDNYLSQTLSEEIKHNILKLADALTTAYTKLRVAIDAGRAPTVPCLSFLIQTFGRERRPEEMHYTYSVAQRVLAGLEFNKARQTDGWFQIENAMVIGLAHHGDVEGAHVHRQRILQQGGAPDADAYGALIYNVKDTTDDASNALELFHEAQTHRVAPNVYLFNNIISKLARARKADYAMELFQQMKALGIPATSVTFGAVIGACARVGDVHSAELLFSEMTHAPNFKPRIPPFNTMMQMYTTTKPDRDRVLHFYNEMRNAKIFPTAHTYKLLLDAYGAIEPVDIDGMNATFQELQANKNVAVQGTHYASLINAHGCVSKDLDAAVNIFNTMSIPADNLVYETMTNVLVVHRRADLFPEYINKMHLAGVHMTAYIANALIKGYSLVDKLQEARDVFESLEDPPVGVAAPNNHMPHSPAEAVPSVDQSSPVYREPSTWEAIIRAELGAGNRDGAIDLLERLKARQKIVYKRTPKTTEE